MRFLWLSSNKPQSGRMVVREFLIVLMQLLLVQGNGKVVNTSGEVVVADVLLFLLLCSGLAS